MHPVIAALPVHHARALWGNPYFETWLEEQGLEWTPRLASDLVERALSDPPPPPPDHPRRDDGDELRAFVKRAPSLSTRLRSVATLCLEQGLSLTACAERLSISRETVRVHLRRLRALHRRALARRHAVISFLGD
jgi:DNA-directed RNA polymerase specialized sigma24 family protein